MSNNWMVPHQDLICPVCQDIFRDPVVLQCSHSFCSSCVSTWWKAKGSRECPSCKAVSSSRTPCRNLVLRNFCDAFLLEVRSGMVCQQHFEKFKLFCLEDRTPLCLVCKHGAQHRDHACVPAEEAASSYRCGLQLHLRNLRATLELIKGAKGAWEQGDIGKQSVEAELMIREEFKILREFLLLEEEARIAALKEEEALKTKTVKDAVDELSKEIADLESTIEAVEEGLKSDDATFLLKVDDMTKEAQRQLRVPKKPFGAVIEVAKHIGNMRFNVWYKMKEIVSYSPVILDPNTAHQELQLNQNLTSVMCGPKLPLSLLAATPDRIHHCILGTEGITWGKRIWEVEVGENPVWGLGVITKDAQKNKNIQSGLWMLRMAKRKFTAYSPKHSNVVNVKGPGVKKVRVTLDYDGGKLTFSDMDTESVIHTFAHAFKEQLFPYFNTWSSIPLKILPVKHSASVMCL